MEKNGQVADYRAERVDIISKTTKDLKPKEDAITAEIQGKKVWVLNTLGSFDGKPVDQDEVNRVMEEIAKLEAERDILRLQLERQDEVKEAALTALDEKYSPRCTDSVNQATPREVELCGYIAKTLEKLQPKVWELAEIREKKHAENELFRKITRGPVPMDINEDLKRYPGMANDLHPRYSGFLERFIRRLSDKKEGPLYGVQLKDCTSPPLELTKDEKAKIIKRAKDSTKRRAKGARVYTENPKLGEDMSTGKDF